MTLQGQIKPISLHGSINVVPNEGGAGGPLQSKTVYPSHEEQIITPDEDYYGLAVVTVKAVPRVPACFADTGYQLPNVVETKVNIGAEVSVTAGKYYTHFLYNGVRLPSLPHGVLASYPYAWIRLDTNTGYYELFMATRKWYGWNNGSGTEITAMGHEDSNPIKWYRIATTSSGNANEWTYYKDYTANNFGISGTRSVVWSNHDIPNGSADATEIYFTGSEPVPID